MVCTSSEEEEGSRKGGSGGGRGGRGGIGGRGGRGGHGGRQVGGGGFNWGKNDSTYEYCTFTNNYY